LAAIAEVTGRLQGCRFEQPAATSRTDFDHRFGFEDSDNMLLCPLVATTGTGRE